MYFRWSTDKINWNEVNWYPRTNTVTQWQVHTVALPDDTTNLPTLYLGFWFVSAYGENCYFDRVQVTADLLVDVGPASNLVAAAANEAQINLAWHTNANGDAVMIAVNDQAVFGKPTNGVAYGVGDAIAGGGR